MSRAEIRTTGRDGDSARRTSQGQQTSEAVLAAAAKIAAAEGLDQVSMRRLSRAAGMSKSGIYAHFRSKEELQLATIEHFYEVFEAEVLRSRASRGSVPCSE